MLVLKRDRNEWVNLRHVATGELIRVCLVEVRGHVARLGIEAAREWNIARAEIDDQLQIQTSESDVVDLGRRVT